MRPPSSNSTPGITHVSYQQIIAEADRTISGNSATWDGINAESVARMRLQNRFQSGLDIARYTAAGPDPNVYEILKQENIQIDFNQLFAGMDLPA